MGRFFVGGIFVGGSFCGRKVLWEDFFVGIFLPPNLPPHQFFLPPNIPPTKPPSHQLTLPQTRNTTENLPTNSPSHHFILPQMRRTTENSPTKLAPTPPNEEKGFSHTLCCPSGSSFLSKTIKEDITFKLGKSGIYSSDSSFLPLQVENDAWHSSDAFFIFAFRYLSHIS